MTEVASGSTFSTIGSSISVESLALITEIFSRTSWIASQYHFRGQIRLLLPMNLRMLVEPIVFTPLIVLTDSSILSVTSMSIISELAPFNRVVILTIGEVNFQERSTPMFG